MTAQEKEMRELLAHILCDIHFTPIQKRIMYVLADGEKHSAEELMRSIDQFASRANLHDHIHMIRHKIKVVKHGLLCVLEGRIRNYQYVLFLPTILEESRATAD